MKNNMITMKHLLTAFIAILLWPLATYSQDNLTDKNRALIIIDVQEFYFPGGFHPLVLPEAAGERAGEALSFFRENGDLVVHVKHATKQDSAIHASVAPLSGEKVITKKFANSFRDTDLLEFLTSHQIEEVVICGMMTHMCVEAAARASADFGFSVIVLDDACATRDIVYGQDTVTAFNVHTTTLGSIDRYYGKVMTVEELTGK